jgi:hypothetical protein
VIWTCFDPVCVGAPLSAARTVKNEVPTVAGVPLINPALDNVKPAGSVPEVIVQLYGAVPPAAVSVWEYGVRFTPVGRGDAVVIASCIAIDNVLDAVCTGVPLSATCTIKLRFPALVGVPLITPELDSVRPAGKAPDVIVQLYGAVPPAANKVSEYAVPAMPVERGDVVLMETGAAAGKAPDVIVQLYGAVPPAANKVSEYAVPAMPVERGDVVLMETGAAACIVSVAASMKIKQFRPPTKPLNIQARM